MYERLKEFMKAAQANRGLDAWDTDHDKILKGFEESVQQLNAYREGHGFTGATGDAMNQWVDASIERIKWYQSNYARGYQSYEMGRQVMQYALAEAETISDDLLDAKTAAMRDDWVVSVSDKDPGGGIEFMGRRYTTGAAYVEAVEAQANAQREAAAARILEQMNSGTARMSTGMRIGAGPGAGPKVPTPDPDGNESSSYRPPDNWTGGTPPIWGGTSSNGYGRNDDRSPSSPNYPDGFNQPWWSEADAAAAQNRIVASGAVPTRELPYGELGSRTNPITDPQELMGTDLLHKSVNGTTYRNGVVGGHTPAPPADAHHPLWRLNGGGASDVTTSGRLGGAGVLGAGALGVRGAARMGSGFGSGTGGFGGAGAFGRLGGTGAGGIGGSGSAASMSGAGRMGAAAGMRGMTGTTNGLSGAGASALKVGSYSGSGFGSYTPPAGSAGAAGAGGANGVAGSSSAAGTTGANGGGAGAAGAAGKGGAGSGGFMGAGAGAGAGAGKEDKKGRKRQYVAFKFEDDEDALPPGYVNPLSQTSGTDKDITPAKRNDDGWDPRQW